MPKILVTGVDENGEDQDDEFEIEDYEFDPGPLGPLTEAAYLRYCGEYGWDDLEFELDE